MIDQNINIGRFQLIGVLAEVDCLHKVVRKFLSVQKFKVQNHILILIVSCSFGFSQFGDMLWTHKANVQHSTYSCCTEMKFMHVMNSQLGISKVKNLKKAEEISIRKERREAMFPSMVDLLFMDNLLIYIDKHVICDITKGVCSQ